MPTGTAATLKTESKSIADLRPASYNPNEMTGARLAELDTSMLEFGYVEPIVWNKRSGNIVGGHQRVKVLDTRGVESIDVVVVDLSDADERTLNVGLNTITGQQEDGALATLLAELNESQRSLAGWDEDAFNQLLTSVRKNLADGTKDPDAVPEKAQKRAKPGDLFALGDHLLLCGDATRRSNVLELFGDKRYDLMLTDPPYGVGYGDKNKALNSRDNGNRIETPIKGDHSKPTDMHSFWLAAFTEARRCAAPGASYYVTGPSMDNFCVLAQALRDAEFPIRHTLIWAKNSHVLGRSDYHYQHEPILYGWVKGRHRFYGGRSQTSLWSIDRPSASQDHPTMKPVELFERAIMNSSRKGRIVFDPFVGSGTCVIAAERTGRRCFAIEIEPTYCDVVLRRWEEFTGNQAEKVA